MATLAEEYKLRDELLTKEQEITRIELEKERRGAIEDLIVNPINYSHEEVARIHHHWSTRMYAFELSCAERKSQLSNYYVNLLKETAPTSTED